ncbi:MAG: hypothetical protein HY855_00860 [Burkholderiales bacterium]|nr:hypothetical protein [Burkholderiales bacterium]
MDPVTAEILEHIARVEALRQERAADRQLAGKVLALKTYQAARFARTYADLLQDARYCGAATFFLDELYGPQEFAARDAQFARIVPPLVRMFPREIAETVNALARLHALSEALDTEMARHLPAARLDAPGYVRIWQTTGQPEARAKQIALTLQIGRALDHYTRSSVLRTGLRMMRGPARAAGLGDLQRFLESGFDTFGAMKGAEPFLAIVQAREEALAAALFDPRAESRLLTGIRNTADPASPLGQLP